jgi:hypothetical protein
MIVISGLSRSLDTVGKRVVSFDDTEGRLSVQESRVVQRASCPKCERRSSRVHGRYWRWLSDTPSFGRPVLLVMEARRFKCINSHCPQQTFSERIDLLAAAGQRRTMRLRDAPLAGVFARRRRCRQASGERLLRRPRGPGRCHSGEALLAHIRAIHEQLRGEYGWPRMHKELVARGLRVGKGAGATADAASRYPCQGREEARRDHRQQVSCRWREQSQGIFARSRVLSSDTDSAAGGHSGWARHRGRCPCAHGACKRGGHDASSGHAGRCGAAQAAKQRRRGSDKLCLHGAAAPVPHRSKSSRRPWL